MVKTLINIAKEEYCNYINNPTRTLLALNISLIAYILIEM